MYGPRVMMEFNQHPVLVCVHDKVVDRAGIGSLKKSIETVCENSEGILKYVEDLDPSLLGMPRVLFCHVSDLDSGEQKVLYALDNSKGMGGQVLFYSGGTTADVLDLDLHVITARLDVGEKSFEGFDAWLKSLSEMKTLGNYCSNLGYLLPRGLACKVLAPFTALDILVQGILTIAGLCEKDHLWWWTDGQRGPEITPKGLEGRSEWEYNLRSHWDAFHQNPCRWFVECFDDLVACSIERVDPLSKAQIQLADRETRKNIYGMFPNSLQPGELTAKLVRWLAGVRGEEGKGCAIYWQYIRNGEYLPDEIEKEICGRCAVLERIGVIEELRQASRLNWLKAIQEEYVSAWQSITRI